MVRLVLLVGRISLYGPLSSKVYFDRQIVSWKIWNTLKGQVRNEKNNSKVGIPDFWVGFLEILGEDEGMNGKDEYGEDKSSRELDNFIATERLSNTVKNTSN